MVTSADMHRVNARDLRLAAIALGTGGVVILALSIFLAGVGANALVVLVADGVGLVLGWSASFPWIRAKEERQYADELDGEDGIADTRRMWLDQCECAACQRSARAAGHGVSA